MELSYFIFEKKEKEETGKAKVAKEVTAVTEEGRITITASGLGKPKHLLDEAC